MSLLVAKFEGICIRWVSKAQVNIGGLNVLTRREGCYARLTLRQATKLGSRDKTHYVKIATHPSMEACLYTFAGVVKKNANFWEALQKKNVRLTLYPVQARSKAVTQAGLVLVICQTFGTTIYTFLEKYNTLGLVL